VEFAAAAGQVFPAMSGFAHQHALGYKPASARQIPVAPPEVALNRAR
jgi:hypothetical protein